MNEFDPSYKTFGNKAILIEWPAKISDEILADILIFKQKIEKHFKGFSDLVSAYNSLTIILKKPITDFNKQIDSLKIIYNIEWPVNNLERDIWHIPVCYDAEFGLDLEFYLKAKKLSIDQLIDLHTKTLYTVYFIGFLPGFPYLGGLQEALYLPRKLNPTLNVPKGSVGIGGKQTGVYTMESPGGWHIIGKTPISFFEVKLKKPCFLKAGDKIKFFEISKDDYYKISKALEKQTYLIKKELYHA